MLVETHVLFSLALADIIFFPIKDSYKRTYIFLYIVRTFTDPAIAIAIVLDLLFIYLFIGRGQSIINCDNFLSNPIAVLFAIK